MLVTRGRIEGDYLRSGDFTLVGNFVVVLGCPRARLVEVAVDCVDYRDLVEVSRIPQTIASGILANVYVRS